MVIFRVAYPLFRKSRKLTSLCKFSTGSNKGSFQRFQTPTAFLGYAGVSVAAGAVLWNYYRQRDASPKVLCEPTANTDHLNESASPKNKVKKQQLSLQEAIEKSQDLLMCLKDQVGTPGIVIGVSVNGENIWTQGFGYCDLENRLPCTPKTVMRIASISKSITMAVVAKLWENGKLDMDKPVQEYVPNFPKKKVNDQPVEITCRHLVSHLSGIRHYTKKSEVKSEVMKDNGSVKESQTKEFLLNERFKTVADALKLFENDELFHKPGEKYLYTTHGWTLISAVVEKIVAEPFPVHMIRIFRQFGMTETYLDTYEPIIYNRSRYYMKTKFGQIQNTPCVDNSYKWAGGGFLSTVGDLLKFGNIMLYSYQHNDQSDELPGYLKQETIKKMWTQVEESKVHWKGETGYGMGWVVGNDGQLFGGGRVQHFCTAHTGGAIGASSILYILPHKEESVAPRGVIVAIITNLDGVVFSKEAQQIAQLFDQVKLGH